MRSRLFLTLALVLVMLVTGCSSWAAPLGRSAPTADQSQPAATVASAQPTATPTVDISPSPTVASSPTAASSPTTAPVPPTASPAGSTTVSTTAATSDVAAAIQAIVQKANQEQQDAFAKNDPTLMKDTATAAYYDEIAKINSDMATAGIASIKLLKIEWGPITLQGSNAAQATTYETWRTVFTDSSTEDSRDRNVYTLTLDQGSWKIQADDHPDANPATNPASTSPTSPTSPSSSTTPPAPSLTPVPGQDASHNWAGYAASNGTYTAVSGTWSVPSISAAGALGVGATWIGIGGTSTRDLIQTGTQEVSAGGGSVRYNAWIETLPDSSRTVNLVVSPGDSVTVSITEQSKDQWLVVLKNNTTGQSYQETVQYTSSHSSVEWIVEAPSSSRQLLPLDNFGTIVFTNGSATVDGKTVTIAGSKASPISMVDLQGSVLASPSNVTSDGKGFTVTRSDVAATTAPAGPSGRSRSGRGAGN
jgi:Peptidase A4 family